MKSTLCAVAILSMLSAVIAPTRARADFFDNVVDQFNKLTQGIGQAVQGGSPDSASYEIQSDSPEIISLAQQITAGLATDWDKALALHDWVATNVQYDWPSYRNGTYVSKKWDALTVLHSQPRVAICYGFSNLYAALLRAIRIPTNVIVGQISYDGASWMDHAWNEVLVNQTWIEVDTTWDIPYVNPDTGTVMSQLTRNYFNPAPAFFAQSHRKKN